jgi:AcrR family transcriptional regulator
MASHPIDLTPTMRTRDRILICAAKRFAISGYAAVSMRDIAADVGITGGSIYSHFTSKEQIFNEILDVVSDLYDDYYDRLDRALERVGSFEQMVDGLFAELLDVYHIFIYYGFTILCVEQVSNPKARDVFNRVFMHRGIGYIEKAFQYCIDAGWIQPFDVTAAAYMIMNSVMAGSLLRVLEDLKAGTPYDVRQMFLSVKQLVANLAACHPGTEHPGNHKEDRA